MTFAVADNLGAVTRSVATFERDGQPARAVTLARSYETTVADLWDAVTNPERLPRWFLPVEGDLRLGGRYQLQGNASGSITACRPPSDLELTWEFGGETSWVEVKLSSDGPERSRLTLVHTAHVNEYFAQYGPGAVGVGWDLGLAALAVHLTDPETQLDEDSFSGTPEGKAFILGSSEAWGEADVASGADPAEARAAAQRTGAFFSGSRPPEA